MRLAPLTGLIALGFARIVSHASEPAAPAKVPIPLNPRTELHVASRVAGALAPEIAKQLRFLSFYNLPAESWPAAEHAVGVALNTVSRARAIHRVRRIPGHESLVAVYWDYDYQLPAELWERLAASDPYWHIRTTVLDPKTGKQKQTFSDGGWVDFTEAAALRKYTGSDGAVLRADYFIAKSLSTLEGGIYYDLAGIPATRDEFYRDLLGIDLAAVDKLDGSGVIGWNTYRSNVTKKPRRILRRQGTLGGAWESQDTINATADRDPFLNLDKFKFDAGEFIAAKPNGLHYFALYDAAGKRANTVPDVLAKDHRDILGMGVLAPAHSCMRCHDTGGILDIQNDQKTLFERTKLLSDKRRDLDRALALFDSPRAKTAITRDRDDYDATLGVIVNDGKAETLMPKVSLLFDEYLWATVDIKKAASELGVDQVEFEKAAKAALSPTVQAMLAGIPVQRQQWADAFQEAALLSAGLPARTLPAATSDESDADEPAGDAEEPKKPTKRVEPKIRNLDDYQPE